MYGFAMTRLPPLCQCADHPPLLIHYAPSLQASRVLCVAYFDEAHSELVPVVVTNRADSSVSPLREDGGG